MSEQLPPVKCDRVPKYLPDGSLNPKWKGEK